MVNETIRTPKQLTAIYKNGLLGIVELNKGILGIVVLNTLKVVKFCLY